MQRFLQENETGRFYTHGIVNWKKHSNTSDGDWTHAVCIGLKDGKFYEYNHPKGCSITKLFINCERDERYLSRIDRVYQLHVSKIPSVHAYNLRKRCNN